jgi:hypothetical protein
LPQQDIRLQTDEVLLIEASRTVEGVVIPGHKMCAFETIVDEEWLRERLQQEESQMFQPDGSSLLQFMKFSPRSQGELKINYSTQTRDL